MYIKCYKFCYLEKEVYINLGYIVYNFDVGKIVNCVSYEF